MKTYDSLIDALADLRNRGYTMDFEIEPNCLYCSELDIRVSPEQFNVDEFYIFGENSSPDDSAVLYVISSYPGIKGTLVDAYGAYAENMSFDMAQKLQAQHIW